MDPHPKGSDPEALLFQQLDRLELEAFTANMRVTLRRQQRARLAALADHRIASLLASLPATETEIELRCGPPSRVHRGTVECTGSDFIGISSGPLHVRIIRTGGIEGYHFPKGLPATPEGGEQPRLPDLATYLFDHVSSGELIEVSRYRDTGVDTRVIRILAVGADFLVVEEDHQIVLIPIESFNELQVRRIEEP